MWRKTPPAPYLFLSLYPKTCCSCALTHPPSPPSLLLPPPTPSPRLAILLLHPASPSMHHHHHFYRPSHPLHSLILPPPPCLLLSTPVLLSQLLPFQPYYVCLPPYSCLSCCVSTLPPFPVSITILALLTCVQTFRHSYLSQSIPLSYLPHSFLILT